MNELHLTDAELVTADQTRINRAELFAMAFLTRYRVVHTRETYEIALRQFFGFCRENGIEPLEANRMHIELFARQLELTGRQVATIAGKLNVLSSFFKYACIDGLIEHNPMVHVSRPKIQRVSTTLGLTRPEFADLIRALEGRPPRDQALVLLLGYNGMRISEALGIDIEHLDRYQGQQIVRILRKGGKHQLVPLAPRTAWQVELTVAHRTEGPLLLNAAGTARMDRRAAARIVAHTARDARITKRITPHSLRHSYVTMSLDVGASERDVAASVGHSDTRLVAYYDRARDAIHRNTTHQVAGYIEGAL
jgi:integrase/recombinase XerD